MNELVSGLVAGGRLLGATALLCAPGVALCWWLYPGRALDLLERMYLSMVASLCLLTLIGVALLEGGGRLDPRVLAYWGAACAAACAVMRLGAAILAWGKGPSRAVGRGRPPQRWKQNISRHAQEDQVLLVRGARGAIPARAEPHCYPVGRGVVSTAQGEGASARGRQGCGDPHSGRRLDAKVLMARWWSWVLPRGTLLGIAALTLLARRLYVVHRASDPWSATGNGSLVAFSIPVDRLADVQADLGSAAKAGGHASIPFCVENLERGERLYRVEAWAAGRAGEMPALSIAAGVCRCAELDIYLTAGTAAPLDLYLYPVDATAPLAHLRVWMEE